ncbi:hypothetical protein [Pseudomonas cremoricolorata]|uniref:hypothetical protein n=1 Tax=Pseudomonas cremoricolorata TaxID=157783 RepID=UPI00042A27BA|nr:hypothetical protein [Pseudomonas cremoricolorata]
MSGPKVVRIVTREEILAQCETALQRLDKATARWQAQAQRLGTLDATQLAAIEARDQRLRALLAQDRFREVQDAVAVEQAFLKRDLRERQAQAIERGAEQRQRQRRVQDNAAVLHKALAAVPGTPASAAALRDLDELAARPAQADAEQRLAQAFALLAVPEAEAPLSLAQQQLAERLHDGQQQPSYAQWLAEHGSDEARDPRLQRIDRHIVELQLLQGDDAAVAFLGALQRAEALPAGGQRNLLLDSLVLDLAAATRSGEQRRERLEQLHTLSGEIAELLPDTQSELLAQLDACTNQTQTAQLDALIERAEAVLAEHANALAAEARRQAVLQGLASLGYEVREGMATGWAQTGRVVLRKPATPGYGVEVGGQAESGRLQVRAVALHAERDRQRDRDIETLWCGDFQRLQALLQAQGDSLSIERALQIGEVPLKEAEVNDERGASEAPLQRHQ